MSLCLLERHPAEMIPKCCTKGIALQHTNVVQTAATIDLKDEHVLKGLLCLLNVQYLSLKSIRPLRQITHFYPSDILYQI